MKLYFLSILSVLIGLSCTDKNDCNCNDYSEIDEEYTVYISDVFSYYPMHLNRITYIDTIDSRVKGKMFTKKRPLHSYGFETCEDAIRIANCDFDSARPSLVQFNGIGGDFPHINEIYFEKLGVYIENTGCMLYSNIDCYNNEIMNLLEKRFGHSAIVGLQKLDSMHRNLIIDPNLNKAVEVDVMPSLSIEKNSFPFPVIINNDSVKCKYQYLLLGRFTIRISKEGNANVINYEEGSLDCSCVELMSTYFEQSIWKPAILKGNSIDVITEIQFLN